MFYFVSVAFGFNVEPLYQDLFKLNYFFTVSFLFVWLQI